MVDTSSRNATDAILFFKEHGQSGTGINATSPKILVQGVVNEAGGIINPATVDGQNIAIGLVSATSAPNAPASVIIPAPGAGFSTQLATTYFGYSDTPTGGLLTVTLTDLGSFNIPVIYGGAGFLPIPIRGAPNKSISLSLSAGGNNVIAYLSAFYRTVIA